MSVIVNIAIGLATSVISGVLVWAWERGKRARALTRKARFFGMAPGRACLIVMNDKYNAPGSAAHQDVQAMIDVATLAGEFGCEVSVAAAGTFTGSNGDRTEFCVGGPLAGSNPRTGGHLAAYLPGVAVHPFDAGPDAAAFLVGGHTYRFDRGEQEYALIAKFTPAEATASVILICGQSATGNRAAVHFLKRAHRELARSVASQDRYCLIVRLAAVRTYGHLGTSLERDVTDAAFAG
ncbi:hypothetical protein V2S66_07755 [Streptomyces sp. V4-01]|uniref:Secreted protein n=1 Tax=Actinacidiphila polyblastidii TaxID=3110430 RepID=A0ABU7P7R5_9ACTN|nr:hypothetical protein [Streptomyces sp. V4-01]